MQFVHPVFLYGLLAVSIPVIIHLFNFRRFKKVYFTNVRFIKEISVETKKRSQLRHLLALIARMLAIAAIVMAFAQPYFPLSEQQSAAAGMKAVSVYIDNSFSMKVSAESANALEQAKKLASGVAFSYQNTDVFHLMTNDMAGRGRHFVSREEFLTRVEEVGFSSAFRTAGEVVSRQTDLFVSEGITGKNLYLISDFQKSFLDQPLPEADSLTDIFLLPVAAEVLGNLYIDSCWFTSPVRQAGKNAELMVRIRNASDMRFEKIPVKLSIDGRQRSVSGFDIDANGFTDIPLYFTNYGEGIVHGMLEINDYPVDFDDKLYFSYYVAPRIDILCINGAGENPFLNALFKNDTAFLFRNVPVTNINYSEFRDYNIIILNEVTSVFSGLEQEVSRFVEAGGSLVVAPPVRADLESYATFLTRMGISTYGAADTSRKKIDHINLEHELFRDVFEEIPENIDLPDVYRHYRIVRPSRVVSDVLLEIQGGEPFLLRHTVNTGQVYLFASPFLTASTGFPRHAVFVPTLYQIALSALQTERLYYVIGRDESLNPGFIRLQGDAVPVLQNVAGDFEFIPEFRQSVSGTTVFLHGRVTVAGNYVIALTGNPLRGVSFNYNRSESEMDFYTPGELRILYENRRGIHVIDSGIKPIEQTLAEFSRGVSLWRRFVLAALIFLALEGIILRFVR